MSFLFSLCLLYRGVKIKPPPLRSKISGFWGRFYFLQNPDLDFFSPEGFIFYKNDYRLRFSHCRISAK